LKAAELYLELTLESDNVTGPDDITVTEWASSAFSSIGVVCRAQRTERWSCWDSVMHLQ